MYDDLLNNSVLSKYIITYYRDLDYVKAKSEKLIECKDCKNYRDNACSCDAWGANTRPTGYCYRAERKEE